MKDRKVRQKSYFCGWGHGPLFWLGDEAEGMKEALKAKIYEKVGDISVWSEQSKAMLQRFLNMF